MLQCRYCSAVMELQLNEIVDRALESYELFRQMDAERIALSREKITQYIGKLTSAGRVDPHQLIECAHAYLRELHEGRDPRFTGC
jgi:hypothetical protein